MKKLLLPLFLISTHLANAAVNVTVNGSSYSIPQNNEKGWGTAVTSWIQAISSNTLQPTGGLFTLSSDIDFGASYGLKSLYLRSRTSNTASQGILRLANTDAIAFRNSTNTGDLLLMPNAVTDGLLQFNGVDLLTASGTQTVTNKTISGASNTLSNIPNSATTATSANTASAIVARDSSGNFSAGTITGTLNGTASNVSGTVAIANGGTGQVTANAALNAILPTQTSNSGKVLGTDGTNTSWVSTSTGTVTSVGVAVPSGFSVSGSPVTTSGTLTIASSGMSTDVYNVGISASVTGNALTVALKQSDGITDPASGAGSVVVGFRSATATSGAYNRRSVAGALSITIPSGTTIGTQNGIASYIYVYAIDNAGTVELALSLGSQFESGGVQNTSAVSGGSSATTLYSTSARTGVPVRLIGRVNVSEVTAGTWASAPSEVAVIPFQHDSITSSSNSQYRFQSAIITPTSGAACTVSGTDTAWLGSTTPNGTGDCSVAITSGTFSSAPECIVSIQDTGVVAGGNLIVPYVDTASTSTLRVKEHYMASGTNTVSAASNAIHVMCKGPR